MESFKTFYINLCSCFAVPDAPPINLTVTNVAPGIVSLHWFSPPLENQNGHIIGYIVRIIDLDPVKIVDIEIDTTTTKTNKGGLKTTHPYNFSVAAITEQGWGPFSHPISIVTLHGGKHNCVVTIPTIKYILYTGVFPHMFSSFSTDRSNCRQSHSYTDECLLVTIGKAI